MDALIETLVFSLIEKTKSKKIKWEKVGSDEQYSVSLETGNFIVYKGKAPQKETFYRITISNPEGDIIFNQIAINRPQIKGSKILASGDYKIMKELHEEIRKSYYRIDETIRGMIDEIGKED